MNINLERPDMVEEAAQTGGTNVFLEILMFVGVFLVAMFFEVIPVALGEALIMAFNPEIMRASLTGDAVRAMELLMVYEEPLMVLQLFATAMMILVTILFCKLIQKRKMRTLGYKKAGMWKEYGIGALAGLGMMAVVVLVGMVTGSLSLKFNPEAGIGMLVLLFAGFMVQGMAEEVLCRGYFLVSLARKNRNVWMGIIVSAIAFGALHLANAGMAPLALVNLVLFGIFAGVYFVKRGNIWGIAAFHSVWNFAQGNIFGILVSGNDFGTTVFTSTINEEMALINGGAFGLEGGILTTIVLVAGTVIVMMTKQKDVA